MHGRPRHRRQSGPPLELGLSSGPLDRLVERERRAIEQVAADSVAHVPRVEARDPRVHLLFRDERGIVDQRREDARLVDPRGPQGGRELVVRPQAAREAAELGDGDAHGVVRSDPVARHSPHAGRVAHVLERSQHVAGPAGGARRRRDGRAPRYRPSPSRPAGGPEGGWWPMSYASPLRRDWSTRIWKSRWNARIRRLAYQAPIQASSTTARTSDRTITRVAFRTAPRTPAIAASSNRIRMKTAMASILRAPRPNVQASAAKRAMRRATASGRCSGTSWMPSIHSNATGGPIVRTRRAASALARAKSAWPGATSCVRAARTSVGTRTLRSSPSVSCPHRA